MIKSDDCIPREEAERRFATRDAHDRLAELCDKLATKESHESLLKSYDKLEARLWGVVALILGTVVMAVLALLFHKGP